MVTGWRLIWLITFMVFILILLVLVKWAMNAGRDEVQRIHEYDAEVAARREAEEEDEEERESSDNPDTS